MAEKKINVICVRCPRGCEIATTIDGYSIVSIEGNVCKLGGDYVKDEITDPKRIVTTTVKVKNGKYPLVPVWTPEPIQKDKIFALMKMLRDVELEAPVKIDRIVLKDIFGTGIDVVSSGCVEAK